MTWEIKHGDWIERLREMASDSVHCCVTSPPYWGLRDYGAAGQLGIEKTPEEYIAKMVVGFREVRRVLRRDGTLWLNLGDSYSGSWARSANPGGKGESSKMQVSNQGSYAAGEADCAARVCPPGYKPKDLVGIPWLLAFALRGDGWWLRSDIIWAKPNPMPESVTDRPTKAHEYIFLLTKSARYFYDAEAIKERAEMRDDARPFGNAGGNRHGDEGKMYATPRNDGERWNENNGRGFLTKTKVPGGWDRGDGAHGTIHRNGRTSAEYQEVKVSPYRNKRSVWEIATSPFPEAHFATFPPKLVEPCILAGCPESGTILDPFAGAGTTGLVALRYHRNFIGIELKAEYVEMARKRIEQDAPLFNMVPA